MPRGDGLKSIAPMMVIIGAIRVQKPNGYLRVLSV